LSAASHNGDRGVSAYERAEALLSRLERSARRLVERGRARAGEEAEDIWAEAKTARRRHTTG
jgi:hypothetical protein